MNDKASGKRTPKAKAAAAPKTVDSRAEHVDTLHKQLAAANAVIAETENLLSAAQQAHTAAASKYAALRQYVTDHFGSVHLDAFDSQA